MFIYLTLLLYEVVCTTGSEFNIDIREDADVDEIIRHFSSLSCKSYKLEDLDECCKINPSGHFQVAKQLDREKTASYSGTLECELTGPPYVTTHKISINIVDVNDNSPKFSQPSQSLTVDETSSVPVTYPLRGATDRDTQPNSVSRYKLIDNTDKFKIETGTWSGGSLPLSLVIIKELDYDAGDKKFVLTIRAFDKDDKSDDMTLTITVNDINDNKPVFQATSYTGSVLEDAGTQTKVLTVLATDRDSGENGKVEYSLVGNNLPFAVRVLPDSSNGDIIVTRALDREKVSSYTFQVVAQDRGAVPRQSSVTVVVTVLDVNDNQPEITSPVNGQTVEVKENLPIGGIVCKVQISDQDTGDNSKISVSIEGSYSERFEYEVKQGDIGQIVTKAVLDREDTASYTLIIRAEDHGSPVRSKEVQFKLVVVDENDNKPSIDNCDQSFTVPENSVGKALEVKASDKDSGRNAELLYSVADTVKYSVDQNGAVSVKTKFDYEGTKSTTVTVTVSDNSDTNPLSSSCDYKLVITDVNDNPPSFQDPGLVKVKEDVERGSLITTLKATDVDTSDANKLTFALLGDSSVFTVEAGSGAVRNLVLLDRETKDHYTIECVVYDSGRLHNDTLQIQIQVLDVSDTEPVFLRTPYKVDLSELAPLNKVVAKAEAMDQDLGDTLTFSISSPYFQIASDTGEISIASTLRGVPSSPLTTDVRVSDGRFTTTTTLSVNVYKDDGQPPLVSQNGMKLSEAAKVGSTAGKCTGTSSSPIRYSLSWDTSNEKYKSVFVIDGESGSITTTGQLDYEEFENYLLICNVTNIHGQSSTATVTVKVEGSNEFAPEFAKTVFSFDTVDHIDSEQKVVGKVEASDADRGNDGILQFFFSDEVPVPGWTIKRSTGEIIQLKQQSENRRRRSLDPELLSKRSAHVSSKTTGQFHTVRLNVTVTDSPLNDKDRRSNDATVYVYVYPYEGGSNQMVLIGAAAGGAVLFLILVVVVVVVVLRRKRSKSGSKDLTYVNPTAYTDKDGNGRLVTDGGYHSSERGKEDNINIVMKEISGYGDIQRNVIHTPYSADELGGEYRDTPIYDTAESSYHAPPTYLSVRDKTTPHKMSVSTVLSDMRNDVQVSAIPHRLAGSVTRTGSYESVHVFGSEGGGEGDAVIDAHSLFNKLSEIDDDVSVINKSAHFLGDQDSAFSSLGSGSSNGDQVTTPYHSEYLQDWKPAFQSVGKICEGMLRNKQFAYKSNHSSSRDTSSENISPNQNAASLPRDSQTTNQSASNGTVSTNQNAREGALTNQNAREGALTPSKSPGSVVSSYKGSREDVISSRPDTLSGHSHSPGQSVSSY